MVSFEIEYPRTKKARSAWNKRFGLNAYYAGKHWAQRKKDADELHDLTHWAMRKCGVPRRVADRPVELRFLFNDNLDCSNHAVLVKAIEDAMKGWVIRDDSRAYVQKITTEFWGGDAIRVEVEDHTP